MDMKKQWTAVLVFLTFIVWQIVSPYYTVYQIKQAVEKKSSHELAAYIDFVLLKRNLKAQLQEKLEQKISLRQNGSFFGSLTTNIASQAIDSMLNRTVTPKSIITLVSNIRSFENDLKRIEGWTGAEEQMDGAHETDYQKVNAASNNAASNRISDSLPMMSYLTQKPHTEHAHNAQWQYQFDSISKFSIVQHRPDHQPVRYVLTRSGLGWKLSNIILP